jgi:hypothetical protein
MEPIRRADGRIVPRPPGPLSDLGKPGWGELRDRQRRRRAVVEEEQLVALIKEYRAKKSTELHDLHDQEIVRRGERILAEMESTENPLIRQGLEESWLAWMRDIKRIISE